jgi:exodeoxyribonuclease V gamma subunit
MGNIRFGMEGNVDDDTALVSWDKGMRRVMHGICMSGSTAYDDEGKYYLSP